MERCNHRLPPSARLDAEIASFASEHGVAREDAESIAVELITKFDMNEAGICHALRHMCVTAKYHKPAFVERTT